MKIKQIHKNIGVSIEGIDLSRLDNNVFQIKDLNDQISILNRQSETLKQNNKTLTTDNQILAEKVCVFYDKVDGFLCVYLAGHIHED